MINSIKNKNLIIIALLIVCGVLAAGLVYTQFAPITPKVEENIVSKTEAAKIGLAYINENLLPQGMEATSSGEVVEEKGLYKFQVEVAGEKIFSYITKDGKILFPQGINLEEEFSSAKTAESGSVIGNFLESGAEVCKEGEKPIVYFFGSQGCPHCTWEHPIIEEVAEQFGDYISFHNNMDSDVDMDVFSQYSTGGIPTLVLGCKYFRVGSGERAGEEEETKVLTALICDLTNNQPVDVCSQVQDLIQQIK